MSNINSSIFASERLVCPRA